MSRGAPRRGQSAARGTTVLDLYWARVDFQDGRWSDPALHTLLEQYWNSVMPQLPDTALAEVHKLIGKAEGDPDMFKYLVHLSPSPPEEPGDVHGQGLCEPCGHYATGKADWLSEAR